MLIFLFFLQALTYNNIMNAQILTLNGSSITKYTNLGLNEDIRIYINCEYNDNFNNKQDNLNQPDSSGNIIVTKQCPTPLTQVKVKIAIHFASDIKDTPNPSYQIFSVIFKDQKANKTFKFTGQHKDTNLFDIPQIKGCLQDQQGNSLTGKFDFYMIYNYPIFSDEFTVQLKTDKNGCFKVNGRLIQYSPLIGVNMMITKDTFQVWNCQDKCPKKLQKGPASLLMSDPFKKEMTDDYQIVLAKTNYNYVDGTLEQQGVKGGNSSVKNGRVQIFCEDIDFNQETTTTKNGYFSFNLPKITDSSLTCIVSQVKKIKNYQPFTQKINLSKDSHFVGHLGNVILKPLPVKCKITGIIKENDKYINTKLQYQYKKDGKTMTQNVNSNDKGIFDIKFDGYIIDTYNVIVKVSDQKFLSYSHVYTLNEGNSFHLKDQDIYLKKNPKFKPIDIHIQGSIQDQFKQKVSDKQQECQFEVNGITYSLQTKDSKFDTIFEGNQSDEPYDFLFTCKNKYFKPYSKQIPLNKKDDKINLTIKQQRIQETQKINGKVVNGNGAKVNINCAPKTYCEDKTVTADKKGNYDTQLKTYLGIKYSIKVTAKGKGSIGQQQKSFKEPNDGTVHVGDIQYNANDKGKKSNGTHKGNINNGKQITYQINTYNDWEDPIQAEVKLSADSQQYIQNTDKTGKTIFKLTKLNTPVEITINSKKYQQIKIQDTIKGEQTKDFYLKTLQQNKIKIQGNYKDDSKNRKKTQCKLKFTEPSKNQQVFKSTVGKSGDLQFNTVTDEIMQKDENYQYNIQCFQGGEQVSSQDYKIKGNGNKVQKIQLFPNMDFVSNWIPYLILGLIALFLLLLLVLCCDFNSCFEVKKTGQLTTGQLMRHRGQCYERRLVESLRDQYGNLLNSGVYNDDRQPIVRY